MNNDYVQHLSGLVRVIDFKKFGRGHPFYGKEAVGHIFIEIKNGLVQNYVDLIIYEDEVDSNGNPILTELNLSPYIKYDLHDNVWSCLTELSELCVLSKDADITVYNRQHFQRAILVRKWSDKAPFIDKPKAYDLIKPDFEIPVSDAFVDFLLEEMEKLEKQEGSFSKKWYLLRISLFYFLPSELTANDIFNIGYFSAQMSDKFSMEEDALKAQKAEASRKMGTLKNSLMAPQKSEEKEAVIIALRNKVIENYGPKAVRIDTTAASYIHELAESERPPELWIASKQRIISESRIRNILGRLRKSGKIV